MKHLYKTKEGEILGATMIDFEDKQVITGEVGDKERIDLSEVQEVVLDKDGEPFMFEGEVVCVGDNIVVGSYNGTIAREVIGYHIFNSETRIVIGTIKSSRYAHQNEIKSHTPKHPQKKGIEKIDENDFCYSDLVEKINQLIDVVNNLTRE